jgi:hypothetical protein
MPQVEQIAAALNVQVISVVVAKSMAAELKHAGWKEEFNLSVMFKEVGKGGTQSASR